MTAVNQIALTPDLITRAAQLFRTTMREAPGVESAARAR